MLDINLIRKEPDAVRAMLTARGGNADSLDAILSLDVQRREILTQSETLRATRNAVSKEIGRMSDPAERDARKAEMRTVGEVAAVMVATGQGFIFMSTAPQAHPTAYAAFVVVLVLLDEVDIWTARGPSQLRGAIVAAWAMGVAGLLYFGHIPLAFVTWVFGAGRVRPAILAGITVTAFAIATAWQWYGELLLGLRFSGGNNDLAGGAVKIWLRIMSEGLWSFRWQFHAGSIRGLLVGTFYYPWWILALFGLAVTTSRTRTWALAVLVGSIAPAIAFSPQFRLPRVSYFAFPAVYFASTLFG